MPELSIQGEAAKHYAQEAARSHSGQEQAEILGQGLAAIAYALVDVAQAIREAANTQR